MIFYFKQYIFFIVIFLKNNFIYIIEKIFK